MMGSATPIPLIEPARGVTEDLIRRLVETFYDRVLQYGELGPIFHQALSHRWNEHLAVMVDFWSSVALRTGRYQGKPQQAHQGMALVEDHFERWFFVFEATAREVCGPDSRSSSSTVRGASPTACRSASALARRPCICPAAPPLTAWPADKGQAAVAASRSLHHPTFKP